MAISPVGELGGSSRTEPSSGDRRFDRRATRTGVSAGRQGEPAGDRVVLSDTARALSQAAGEEAQLHLSPAELRSMIAPPEEPHVR